VCRRGDWVALVERRSAIDTHRLAAVSQTIFKDPRVVVRWHVPVTAKDVVNVLTPDWRHRAGFTRAEAKLIRTDEIRPFEDLLELSKCTGEDESTDGISVSIRPMGIELATGIPWRHIDPRTISTTSNLNEIRGLHEMRSGDSAVWD